MSDESSVPEELLRPYDHHSHERDLYQQWEETGCFSPDGSGDPYTIVMPPPNANGLLHAGHAFFVTLEDIMTRYARMRGKRTLWVPGADHAGFETQVVYEKHLSREGRSRFDLSRNDLYREILTFTEENRKHMEQQLRLLGASCDWSSARFTLDEDIREQVYRTFYQLNDDGLLYRDLRSVHWCPKHQTGFSDLELVHETRKDPFYYFQYGPFVIGTVRPETKFADKYIVVHPDDDRYAQYEHGQTFEVPWIEGTVTATLIKDEAGDPERGSGVMTITPWHAAIDWEIARRHNLSYEQIIDERGKLLPIAGEFAGRNAVEARSDIVAKLKEQGLLVRIDESYEHTVPTCYKCGRDIEPQLKKQWFVNMQPLAAPAIDAITNGDVSFVTERYRRIALHWLKQVQDWNISRQIAWGIPIPALVCNTCGHGVVSDEEGGTCPECSGVMEKDQDTFDTWFSSAQWPFLVLGYPDDPMYKERYPIDMMETGQDILFFWVIRMIVLGLYRTGKVPFRDVYLHGLVSDSKGVKMSKSKGNVVDPIDIANEYGTDALRMAYVVGIAPGENMPFSVDKVRGYKKFANKLWNMGRFVCGESEKVGDGQLAETDQAALTAWKDCLRDVTDDMECHRYHLAGEKLYHYTWHTFADTVIEESKAVFSDGSSDEQASRATLLLNVYAESLAALHPFMPFVTEALWKHIPEGSWKSSPLLIKQQWPSL
ncbi:MAG: valine--tRNA ligase [Candidatus Kaiserbacteria bacterium]|nr:valine--tRNA ligase [Candidatus Kaiserbacteria bacterium]